MRRAVMAIVATHLAASAGAFTWMALEWWTRGKPSVLGMISGAVAGLGTITPASGFVMPMAGGADRPDRRQHLLLVVHLAQDEARLRQLARRVRRARHRRVDRHVARRRVRGRRALSVSPDTPQGVAGLLEGNPISSWRSSTASSSPSCGPASLTFVILKVIGIHRAAARAPGRRGHGARRQPARRGAAVRLPETSLSSFWRSTPPIP